MGAPPRRFWVGFGAANTLPVCPYGAAVPAARELPHTLGHGRDTNRLYSYTPARVQPADVADSARH